MTRYGPGNSKLDVCVSAAMLTALHLTAAADECARLVQKSNMTTKWSQKCSVGLKSEARLCSTNVLLEDSIHPKEDEQPCISVHDPK